MIPLESTQLPFQSPGLRLRQFHGSPLVYKSSNPHSILGVPKTASMAEIKRSFIKLALEHHPDRTTTANASHDRFVQIRHAFEELMGRNNNSNNSTTPPSGWSSEELEHWWSHQAEATKEFLTFDMSESTKQEVIHVYRTMAAGGKDKGGYWEMARQLAERHEAAGDKEPTRLLEPSESGVTRRRRKR